MGRFLVLKRTWITVVVGVGVDFALLYRVIPKREWWQAFILVGCSSIPIIFRSLHNELGELMERMHVIKS